MHKHRTKKYLLLLFGIFCLIALNNTCGFATGDHDLGHDRLSSLRLNAPHVKIKEVASGLKLATQMAFLDSNDILVLEKNNGTVRRVVNGNLLGEPLLDLNVATKGEKGMLGIAVSNSSQHTFVFIYFTMADSLDGGKVLGNMLYRYEFHDNMLTDPKLLLHLPAKPGPYHYGGGITIGTDGYVYLSIGDLTGSCEEKETDLSCLNTQTNAQNYVKGREADGRAGILRVTMDGKAPNNNHVVDKDMPYYAYGIRNSFGLDFDPETGKLWDTENGPDWGDEINLVEPGFNSGWKKVQGMWTVVDGAKKGKLASEQPGNLVDFDGKGRYSSPEFTWNQTVGPTALKFLNSNKYGVLKNDMFVADSNHGRIYHFKLNENRNSLVLQGALKDKVADLDRELSHVVFAEGFGLITDLEIDPDGYLYILTYGSGKIFMLVPTAK